MINRFLVPLLAIALIAAATMAGSCSGSNTEYSKLSTELTVLVDNVSDEFHRMSKSLDQWSSSKRLADAVAAMQSASKSCSNLVETETAIVAKAVELMNHADNDEQVKAAQNTVDAFSAQLEDIQLLESSLNRLSYTQSALHSLSGAVNAIDSSRRSDDSGHSAPTVSEAMSLLDDLAGSLKSGVLEEAIGAESATAVADMTQMLSSIETSSSEAEAVWGDEVDDIVLESEAALSELKVKVAGLTREVLKGTRSISSASTL